MKPKRLSEIPESLLLSVITNYFLLENSSNCKNITIVCIGNDNSCLAGTCMNNLTISSVDAYMTGVAYDVARLRICKTAYVIALTSVSR